MIICALYKRTVRKNKVKSLGVELQRCLDTAKECKDEPTEIAAELGLAYCDCAKIFYSERVNNEQSIYFLRKNNPKQLTNDLVMWGLDYQQRAYTLFNFIRDRFRNSKEIRIEEWIAVDEKHADAGYFDRRTLFVDILVLAKKLEGLIINQHNHSTV